MVTFAPQSTGTTGLRRFLHQSDHAPSIGVEPPDWCMRALCAQTDPGVFFPEKGESTRPAKLICSLCPVRVICLDWALGIESRSAYCFGIYGGVSARDRTQMLRDMTGESCGQCGSRFRDLATHRRRHPECGIAR